MLYTMKLRGPAYVRKIVITHISDKQQ